MARTRKAAKPTQAAADATPEDAPAAAQAAGPAPVGDVIAATEGPQARKPAADADGKPRQPAKEGP
jgi:hypothetical protein